MTLMMNVSSLPLIFKSFGTSHEYPQEPSHPKGIAPSATASPSDLVMTTFGSIE